MKQLLTILCLVLLVSCSPPPEVPDDKLVERQGIKYEVNSDQPFTGISVEYDVDTIINGHWNTPLTWSDLVDYRGFYVDLYDQTRQSLDTGLSVQEAVAAYEKPARYGDFAANKGGSGFTVDAIVNYIYRGI